MPYKLTVSAYIEFDVRFSLNDSGEDRQFGMRLRAKRIAQSDLGEALKATVGDFIAARDVQLKAWDGAAPLVSESDGEPAAPDAAAFAALLDQVPNLPGTVLAAYLDANGAKGRLGN